MTHRRLVPVLIWAVVTVLVFSGCLSSPSRDVPLPTPTPTPFPIPTPPLPVDECPASFQSVIYPTKTQWGTYPWDPDYLGTHFRILITFDEDITLLDDRPAHWGVLVRRALPWVDEATGMEQEVLSYSLPAFVHTVEQVGNRVIRLSVLVVDDGSFWPENIRRTYPALFFYGLLCSFADYERLIAGMQGAGMTTETTHADQVLWSYRGSFAYADGAGYLCPESCSFGGVGCCEVPCPDGPEPIEWCPVGGD
ncbi:MAG TPA: hypothetical protein VLH40_04000 [Atribacteraceae bacterium]|nr:hypothetical protein [Atribacteraceae bacterium]